MRAEDERLIQILFIPFIGLQSHWTEDFHDGAIKVALCRHLHLGIMVPGVLGLIGVYGVPYQ